MLSLYDSRTKPEEAKTLADFFGRRFFGGKNKPSVPSTNKTIFFMVEDSSEIDDERLDCAA